LSVSIDHYGLALIDNLETDIQELRFTPNLRLVRLDLILDPRGTLMLGKDAIDLAKKVVSEGRLPEGRFRTIPYQQGPMATIVQRTPEFSNHALEWHFVGEIEDPFNEHYDRYRPNKLFSDVITSLRLLKPGLVGRFGAVHAIRGDPSGIEGAWSLGETLNYQPSPMNLFERYQLQEEGLSHLRKIFDALSVCTNQQIRIALNRFDLQYARGSEVDRLIDLIVAFEALYLKGISDAELRFRLAARVARHLGEDQNERSALFRRMSAAYEMRSRIVHGSIDSLRGNKLLSRMGWNSPFAMLNEMEDMLRRAIRLILVELGTEAFASIFHAALDRAIISGER